VTETFWHFLLDARYKDATRGVPVVLPPIPTNSPSGLREYATRLGQVTASDDWIPPNATIGRPLPEPANCWIASDRFAPDPDAPAYPDDNGTQARDELGLVHCRDGSFLLRLRFPSDAVARSGDSEMARPSFADLGNSRFSVRQISARAAIYAAAGWGATVHLGKFANGSSDITGTSERVTRPLRAASLSIAVEFLGPVRADRGVTMLVDDDDAFADRVQRGRTPTDLRTALMLLLE